MTLSGLHSKLFDRQRFVDFGSFAEVAKLAIEFLETSTQAQIIAKNEPVYCFYQFNESESYRVTRPINRTLWFGQDNLDQIDLAKRILTHKEATASERLVVQRAVYSVGQSFGAILDSHPVPNKARKHHGELFEQLCRVLIQSRGLQCESETIKIDFDADGVQDRMKYQLDLVIRDEDDKLLAVGSSKTTSKDRLDKVFLDQHVYHELNGEYIPHFATVLNDVQRSGKEPNYKVSSTFLSGRFKGLCVALQPLCGVFYCDPRPAMATDPLLADQIHTIDHMIYNWLPTIS